MSQSILSSKGVPHWVCLFVSVCCCGCVTGPVRSVTVGHKQSATVEWCCETHPAFWIGVLPAGLITDASLIAADTTVKTVDNVFCRPAIAYVDMWKSLKK